MENKPNKTLFLFVIGIVIALAVIVAAISGTFTGKATYGNAAASGACCYIPGGIPEMGAMAAPSCIETTSAICFSTYNGDYMGDYVPCGIPGTTCESCTVNADCNDSNSCTNESCVLPGGGGDAEMGIKVSNKYCMYDTYPDETQCTDDYNPCTYDYCLGGECNTPAYEGEPCTCGYTGSIYGTCSDGYCNCGENAGACCINDPMDGYDCVSATYYDCHEEYNGWFMGYGTVCFEGLCETEAPLLYAPPSADLRVIKVGKPDKEVKAGQEITYTTIVDNLGTSYELGQDYPFEFYPVMDVTGVMAPYVTLTDEILSDGDYFEVFPEISDRPAYCEYKSGESGGSFYCDEEGCGISNIGVYGGHFEMTCVIEGLEVQEPSDYEFDQFSSSLVQGRWTMKIKVRSWSPQSINNIVTVFSGVDDTDKSNNMAQTEHEVIDGGQVNLGMVIDCVPTTDEGTNFLNCGIWALNSPYGIFNNGMQVDDAENVVLFVAFDEGDITKVVPKQGMCNTGGVLGQEFGGPSMTQIQSIMQENGFEDPATSVICNLGTIEAASAYMTDSAAPSSTTAGVNIKTMFEEMPPSLFAFIFSIETYEDSSDWADNFWYCQYNGDYYYCGPAY